MLNKAPKRIKHAIKHNPDIADELGIKNPKKLLGYGTRGVVYASKRPDVIIKVTHDEREILAAKRLQKLNLKHVVKIHGCIKRAIDGQDLVFTYLDRLEPLDPRRKAAIDSLRNNGYKFNFHKPRTLLAAINVAIEDRAPRPYKQALREYRDVMLEIINASEWHRDLKSPNMMLSKEGVLQITDIGSFTERPLVAIKKPLVVRTELEDIAKKLKKAGYVSDSVVLRKMAETYFEGVNPLGHLGPPDPHTASESSEVDSSEMGSSSSSERWIPAELFAPFRPDDGKYRNPSYTNDVRQPYKTQNKQYDRMNFNDDNAKKHPVK